MFKTVIKEATKVPMTDYMHLVGVDSTGTAKIGDKITDGTNIYSIVSFPLLNRKEPLNTTEIDICIPLTSDNLIGKVLYSI